MYHISFEGEEVTKLFTPRVPASKGDGEDSVTPRICLSPTIEQALMARTDIVSQMALLRDGKLERDIKFMAYSYDIKDTDKTIGPEELYDRYEITDTAWTEETWLLTPVTLTGVPQLLCDYTVVPYQPLNKEDTLRYQDLILERLEEQEELKDAVPQVRELFSRHPLYNFVFEVFKLVNTLYGAEAGAIAEDIAQDALDDIAQGSGMLLDQVKLMSLDLNISEDSMVPES